MTTFFVYELRNRVWVKIGTTLTERGLEPQWIRDTGKKLAYSLTDYGDRYAL